MSHCAPKATLKNNVLSYVLCFEFMPRAIMRNVFVAQVCWKAVANTWPSSSKAYDDKCVECVVSKLNEERF